MAFGLGKKRETNSSRSSRPLSMIIPEQMKLFSKKSRSVIERAVQEQSKKVIEGSTFKYAADNISHIHKRLGLLSPETSSQPTQVPVHSDIKPVVEADREKSVSVSNPQVASKPSDNNLATIVEHAPILTLNLEDNRQSLLGLSEHYSYSDGSKESLVTDEVSTQIDNLSDVSSFEKKDTDPITPQSPESLQEFSSSQYSDDSDVAIQDGNSKHASQVIESPVLDAETLEIANLTAASERCSDSHKVLELDSLSDGEQPVPWTLKARDIPIVTEHPFNVPELDTSSETDNLELEPSSEEDRRLSEVSLAKQNSAQSEPSTLDNSEELIVDFNRKIILHKGVYIFGSCENAQQLAELRLNDDDLMNPFEIL